MKHTLSKSEKEELKRILDEEERPQDKSWLMVQEYKKKKSRFNCALCEKTHTIKNCPNKIEEKEVEKDEYLKSYASQYSYNEH